MNNVYEQVDRNKRRSWIVILCFFVFVISFSIIISLALDLGFGAVGVGLIISGIMTYLSYYNSDKIILSISQARPADKQTDFDFYTVAENLSLASQIPMPKLYVIDDTALNAFATGRDPEHAVVVATTGLLQLLDRSELEGVVAHEISHINNYDIRLMSIVTILVGMITLVADMFLRYSFWGRRGSKDSGQLGAIMMIVALVLAALSPVIAQLIQLAISRQREYLADASAVKLTRYPDGLIRALQKISQDKEPLEAANKATAHMYISNPLKNQHGGVGWFAGLFNTHPPIEDRIATLQSMQ